MSNAIEAMFAAALKDMENPVKDSQNPHFKSTYASLGAVLGIVKPCLAKHGLVLHQHVTQVGDNWALVTTVMDDEGHKFDVDRRPFTFSGTPQQNGSEETYLRRYALMCCMGLSAEDDDGNEATTGAQAHERMMGNLRKAYKAWRDRAGLSDDEAQLMCLKLIGKPIGKDLTADEVTRLLDYMREG